MDFMCTRIPDIRIAKCNCYPPWYMAISHVSMYEFRHFIKVLTL